MHKERDYPRITCNRPIQPWFLITDLDDFHDGVTDNEPDNLTSDYLPERNSPLGGTITFADGDYPFPLNLHVDKLEQMLCDQVDTYYDEMGASVMPTIRVRQDNAVYDVEYQPNLECRERRATFIAKRDQYGQDLLTYTDLTDVVPQTGLGQFTDAEQPKVTLNREGR